MAMEIQWESQARALFQDLMGKGPPEAFKDSASAAIEREAERGARERGVNRIEREDVARACLRVAPPAFRPRVMKNLAAHGLDGNAFLPPDKQVAAPPAAPKKLDDSYDSEWDRVHARLAGHREEVSRIYAMKQRTGPLRVLDLACGTGKHLQEFARDGHVCHGVDQQGWKLEKAAEQARAQGLDISFTNTDLKTLDLGGRFDLVVCLYAMSTMTSDEDARATLSVARRHLAEDGIFVFNVINKAANSDPNAPMYRSVHVEHHLRDYTFDEVVELLRGAGLEPGTTQSSTVLDVKDLDLFIAARHGSAPHGK
ncbi:class I SAM-dependent methyltransferase [Myxococcus stipitatus]|uniref:class I SAM-dependent DNA methyltransferase n=1 Tax=Myxococcus stipitatus TaxID=83455 RepID=UPI0031455BBF